MLSRKASIFYSVQLALLLSLSGLGSGRAHAQRPALEVESHCRSSSRSDYTVQVCIVEPQEGAVLAGVSIVSATVSVTGDNPGVQRMTFGLDGDHLLTDYGAPYIFRLPTTYFDDGDHTLTLAALMRDGYTSESAEVAIAFNNNLQSPAPNSNPDLKNDRPATGIIEEDDIYNLWADEQFGPPPNPEGLTPRPATAYEDPQAFVVAATGDGAGGELGATRVTNLIASWNPGLFLYLGDVYEKGTYTEFYNWYGLPGGEFFGRFHNVTKPAIGNHEYEDGAAPGYFYYWNNIPNYFSFDAGGWHFISLNSTYQFGQTGTSSGQYLWLRDDLEDHAGECTIVFFHHPVYSIGPQGDTPSLTHIWKLLADHNVPLVLTGHDHNYQRWHPLDRDGNLDADGITQFVVGTGGHGLIRFARSDARVARSFDNAFGALRLGLSSASASFQFVNGSGSTLDSGTVPCAVGGTPPPTSTATPPATSTTTPRPTSTATPPPASTATPSRTPTVTPSPAPALTFTPVADAYVSQGNANTNYGTASTLRVDAVPIVRSYLRFNVQGLTGTVTRATLRVYAYSVSSTGYQVRRVTNNSWLETALTYNNAPGLGTAVGASGPIAGGAWTSADVTSLVTGNGLVSLALITTNDTAFSLASREAGSRAPKLVIETAPSLVAVRPAAELFRGQLELSVIVAALTGLSVWLLRTYRQQQRMNSLRK